jgi:hypothetical protein
MVLAGVVDDQLPIDVQQSAIIAAQGESVVRRRAAWDRQVACRMADSA